MTPNLSYVRKTYYQVELSDKTHSLVNYGTDDVQDVSLWSTCARPHTCTACAPASHVAS